MSRGSLFQRLLGRLQGAAASPGESDAPPAAAALPFLRPPGATPEPEFLVLCERCTECRDACPWDVILPLGEEHGRAEATPAIFPWQDACRLCSDMPCIEVCPSGALTEVAPEEVRMGTAVLEPERCLAVQGESCRECVAPCPVGERALVWEGDRPRILASGCTGCGMCVEACPARPRALAVQPVPR